MKFDNITRAPVAIIHYQLQQTMQPLPLRLGSEPTDRQTDRPTDRLIDGPTDRLMMLNAIELTQEKFPLVKATTDPFIEMRGRIKKARFRESN